MYEYIFRNKTWNNRNEENQYVSELNDIDMELNMLWRSLLISLEVEMSTVCVCVCGIISKEIRLSRKVSEIYS